MFKIGDFSKIARVSTRLLRHYDSIGLLSPGYTDPSNGYRYYMADQLLRLNRILALRELELSLEQIGILMRQNISSAQIRGIYMLRQSELQANLEAEQKRLAAVQTRLRQLDTADLVPDEPVILKAEAAFPYLSLRQTFDRFDNAIDTIRALSELPNARLPRKLRHSLKVVAHCDFDDEQFDLELGFRLAEPLRRAVTLRDGRALTLKTMEAAPALATLARSGPPNEAHLAFGALGYWMEANGYEIGGPSRELILKTPFELPDPGHAVVEIQFPVRPVAIGD